MLSARSACALGAVALFAASAAGARASAGNCNCSAGAEIPRSFQPDWSPNGRQIAFVRRTGAQSDIFVMNRDGSSQRRVTRTDHSSEHDPAIPPRTDARRSI